MTPAAGSGVAVTSGAAGAPGSVASDGPGLTRAELLRFLKAAESRIGLPYVWGAAGPGRSIAPGWCNGRSPRPAW